MMAMFSVSTRWLYPPYQHHNGRWDILGFPEQDFEIYQSLLYSPKLGIFRVFLGGAQRSVRTRPVEFSLFIGPGATVGPRQLPRSQTGESWVTFSQCFTVFTVKDVFQKDTPGDFFFLKISPGPGGTSGISRATAALPEDPGSVNPLRFNMGDISFDKWYYTPAIRRLGVHEQGVHLMFKVCQSCL